MRSTLTLVLKGRYFDMIASGIKKEEYREMSLHWRKVFICYPGSIRSHIRLKGLAYPASDVDIIFAKGYQSNRPTVKVPCTGISIGPAKPEWSGPEFAGQQFFVIKFGEITDRVRC